VCVYVCVDNFYLSFRCLEWWKRRGGAGKGAA